MKVRIQVVIHGFLDIQIDNKEDDGEGCCIAVKYMT